MVEQSQTTDKKHVMIHVEDLWKSYNGNQVLKGLSIDIFEGETLVILGKSGVGKSVLLRQILGIEKADRGFVEIEGVKVKDIANAKQRENYPRMGMLFQGAALFDSLNVGENTAFYLNQHEKLTPKEVKDRVSHALEMVGLAGVESKMPSELSGGMRKRAALARLIVYRPSILLYDEPTTGLDPMTANQINHLINLTKEELKATSIVVTHDIRSAIEVGDRLGFHHDGIISPVANKKDFFKIDDPNIQSFYQNAVLTGL